MAKKCADQLVEMLVNAGIKRVYAVTGDSLNFLNDAIRRDGRIKWINVRHEESAAYAASAEAQLNGIGCCAGSSGPGHVHLINGLYDAHRAGAPVIAIASTCNSYEFGTEYFQETNTIKLFDDCSYYNQVATTAEQLPRMAQAAIQHAISRKGVAVLGLPGDVTEMVAVESRSSMQQFFPNPTVVPSAGELRQLASLINAGKKITLFCGYGAAGAHDEVVKLAGLIKAPVGYSYRGKMFFQHDNPFEIGMTGLLGLPTAFRAMHESDLVVMLGTDFPYTPFMPVKNKIVQIDAKAERLGRRAKLALGLQGKIKETLEALMPLVDAKENDAFLKEQLKGYEKVKDHLTTYVTEKGKKDAIHPELVGYTVDRLAATDAIFTVDTGMCCVWGARYIHATGKREMIGSFSHGSMANAMPQAIGAALSQAGRQVIAFCGDGGLSMLLGDLATIKQYHLPVKIVVFNNHALGMVKLEMEVAGLPDSETDMVNPDFALVAQAMGFPGFTISDPEEVESGISKALAMDGPVLVNVITDPNALAMPPSIEMKQVTGMVKSMGKLMLAGEWKEVVDTISSNIKHAKEVFD